MIAETAWQLEDFVDYLQAAGFSNYQTNALAGALDGSASKREPKELLSTAKVNLDNFDFVGLHEEWQLSVALLRETFGLKGSWESRIPAAPVLSISETVRAAILRTQANDVALYAYARELFHSRAEKFGLTVQP